MRKVEAEEPSSFEKISHKLGGDFFEQSSEDIFMSQTSNSILADRMAQDAKIQEIFQAAGEHQKKNWAKPSLLSRDMLGHHKGEPTHTWKHISTVDYMLY